MPLSSPSNLGHDSVDRRDPVERKLAVDTSGGRPLSAQVDKVKYLSFFRLLFILLYLIFVSTKTDGRPGRPRFGPGRSIRLLRPATSPSLPQVTASIHFLLV